MLGSVQEGGDALVRLNDAFAPDPVVRRRARRASASTRRVLVVHWCDARRRPSSRARACAPARAPRVSVVEVFAGAGRPDRTLVVPVTELAAADGASLVLRLPADAAATPPGRSPAWPAAARASRPLRTFTVGLGAAYDRVRADVVGRRQGRPQRDPLGLPRRRRPRCTTSAPCRTTWPPAPTSELLCQGAVAGHVALGLQRADPGAPRRRAQRRPPDQPQPRPRRGGARRLGAQPRHPRERRALLPRLDGGTGRRGPALLHRVARRGARGGRGPHRARLLRRHHRPLARPRGHPVPRSARCTSASTSPWAAGRCPPVSETVALCRTDDLASGRGPALRRGRPPHRARAHRRRRSTPSTTSAATRTTRCPRARSGPRSARSSAPATAARSTC